MLLRIAILLFILLNTAPGFAQTAPLNIILFSPNHNDQDFWGEVHSFARASAYDLGISLKIIYNATNNRFDYLEQIHNVLSGPNKPDAFMAVSYRRKTQKLLALSTKYQVPVILIINDIPHESRQKIGLPRTHYPTYLAHISPNDSHMSYLLTKYLINQARAVDYNNTIDIVGIAGSRETSDSTNRNQGLLKATEEHDLAQLKQIVYANWKPGEAYLKSKKLIQRHKTLDIIWCASDLMALNARQAIQESRQQIITGGFDWTREAIEGIRLGHIAASVGGHFTDAGYALVLLHDYLNGQDFAQVLELSLSSSSNLIHRGNIEKYYDLLTKKNWQSIDFKNYSRVYHPENDHYDFSIERLLQYSNKTP